MEMKPKRIEDYDEDDESDNSDTDDDHLKNKASSKKTEKAKWTAEEVNSFFYCILICIRMRN